jgi:acetyl esterase/lipase
MFTSCVKPVQTDNNSIPPETRTDIAYGADPKQRMDIYLPANRNVDSTKLIVFVHGGGWNEGDKADFTPYVKELQKRLPGYAFANINYRLFDFSTGVNKFPTQENDVKASIDFLHSKSAEYKISKATILLGASAGGHLVLLHGYKNNTLGGIKAIVSFFGPSDLADLYKHRGDPRIPLLLIALTGATPTQNQDLYQQSSPLHFVTGQSPPTLILHGGKDALVPESQSVLLKNKLEASAVAHQYVYYPNEGHGWTGNNLFDSFNKIEAFILKY